MASGYSGKFLQRQCRIQVSRINLGENKVLNDAFFRLSREPKIPTFCNYKPPVLSYSGVGTYDK